MGKTIEKITENMKIQLLSLYEEGKIDSEIARILKVSSNAIYYWRKKLNLKSKFTYSKISKINKDKFEELFNKGLSDYKIAKILGVSPEGIYSYRIRHHYVRESLSENKAIELSDFQKQVLLGTLLGDSSFKMGKGSKNPAISCSHSIKQKEYCEYKTKIFENLGATCKYHKRNIPDKRNGILYEDYTMYVPANSKLKDWYTSFYVSNKKIIPFDLFDNFTEVSLAFMYMDDGFKINNSYSISTNCFTYEQLFQFKEFLLKKFGIDTSIHKGNILYIKMNSRNLFTQLISPYFCECMKYKLQSLNSVNLGKSGNR